MNVGEAKEIARDWVNREGSQTPGFLGALFAGSNNWRADDEVMPSTSDLDIMIWADTENRSSFKKKIADLVLEVAFFPHSRFAQEPEAILSDFRYACHFAVPNTIIADRTGHLTKLQNAVTKEYARRRWVEKRCEHAHYRLVNEVLTGQMRSWILSDAVSDRLLDIYYGVLLSAQIFALADLRNPTVRKSMVMSHEVLKRRNRLDLQERLLEIMGVAGFDKARVDAHFQSCVDTYSRAVEVFQTPFFFSNEVEGGAREIAIDGTNEIRRIGLDREAMFWIHFVYSNAQKVIQNDAPESEKTQYLERYLHDIAELGFHTESDFEQRKEMNKALAPQIMEAAAQIMDNNPRIIE